MNAFYKGSVLLSIIKVVTLTFTAILFFNSCQNNPDTLFELRKSTGIAFNNKITENDSMNILELEYFYRGGGVAIGDLNNDQLPEVILGGNMVPTRLYLNKGNLQFEDITEEAGILTDKWVNGISLVDINQDGLMDIYLCVGGSNNPERRKNLFYIQQVNKGIPLFEEKAKELGLDVNKSSTQAAFFDYDLDGDLDAILVNTDPDSKNPNVARPKVTDGTANNADLFFENRLNEEEMRFVEVSKKTGIIYDGFSLGLSISDINMDGWPDIYIANDHLSNDILYINQKDKTFKNLAPESIKTQSYFSMGVFLKDVDNNGRNDVFTLDMLPETYSRRQRMMMAMNLSRFQMAEMFGYQPQFMKNTLQLNWGNKNEKEIAFAEAAQLAGMHNTDWSWGSVIADFDQNGHNDIIIANGYARNITDMDFVTYQTNQNFFKKEINNLEHKQAITQQPAISLQNYAYKNLGDLEFEEVSKDWGLKGPDLSNGIAYGDLDLDGDLDLVINHINQQASVYENKIKTSSAHYIKLRTVDKNGSPLYGTKAFLHVDDTTTLYQELFPVQGYQSNQEPILHFGLGKKQMINAVEIVWPNNSSTKLNALKVDSTYTVEIPKEQTQIIKHTKKDTGFFKELTQQFNWQHQPAMPFGDMEKQSLLHQTFSKETPPLAVADIDNNGLLDFYVGSGLEQKAVLFKQIRPKEFIQQDFDKGGQFEDTGAIWFDADQDGDLDLYVCSGNTNFWEGHQSLQDRLYLQTPTGWQHSKDILPELKTYTKAVVSTDFDQDGDEDLLVFGRMVTGKYPTMPASYLLENNGSKFTDKSHEFLPTNTEIGMVSDALKADIDADGKEEIILAGEWQKIRYLKWNDGKFQMYTIENSPEGWWHAVHVADINQDGYPDILCGNAGLNNDYAQHLPLHLYATDIEGDGNPEPLLGWHIKNENAEKDLYPAFQRDDLMSQFSFMRTSFSKYADFATVDMEEILKLSKQIPEKFEINDMRSLLLINNQGNGFTIQHLPKMLQSGPITSFITSDFDKDGAMDILCLGNAQNMHISRCWNSDFYAQLLLNKNGSLELVPIEQMGTYIDSEVRAAKLLGENYFITSNYADSLVLYGW